MTLRGYIGQVLEVRPILAAMEDRGLPVDDAARRALDQEFDLAQQELLVEITAAAPGECGRVHPKAGYKGVPPEIKTILHGYGPTDDLQYQSDGGIHSKRFIEPYDDGESYRYEQRPFDVECIDLAGEPSTMVTPRWCRVYDFNPNSPAQLKQYMRVRNHKVPKSKDEDANGQQKDTTAKKELVRLAKRTGDSFYLKVIHYRELTKLRGTYIEGFAPHADGCVHTTFTFDTGIGQLSCCAPWTPVRTRRGEIPISAVRVGDLVWTHRARWRHVTATWVHPPQNMVDVQFSNGIVLTCTTSHRVLLLSHEHNQEVDHAGECAEGPTGISQRRSADLADHCPSTRDQHSYGLLDTNPSNATCRTRSTQEATVLALKDGQEESTVRQDWQGSSELDRRSGRWARIFDLLSGWEASVCASSGLRQGAWYKGVGTVESAGGPSHQRGSNGQQHRQLSASHQRRTQVHTLAPANGGEVVAIEKIVPVGRVPVHDITVDEDESYETCGVFSHNSRNPNIQNFPKHGSTESGRRLNKAIRKMIAAKPGNVLVEWDFKSCHVLTLGYLARDTTFIRLARLDMHSFVTGHILGLWDGPTILCETDDQLRARFKWLKSNAEYKRVRDDQAKHAILGIGNGLKAKGLYERYMEEFADQRTAKRFLDVAEQLFPKVFEWQRAIQRRAHEQRYLRTEFGHIRRFYEVFRWDARRGNWGHGDQAEEAISFWLSNIAFGHIRDKMKDLAARGLDATYGLVNNVHDSYLFHFPADRLAQHVRDVYPVLIAPSRVLVDPEIAPGGLHIDVEAAVGVNWGEMAEVDVRKYINDGDSVLVGAARPVSPSDQQE